MKIYIIMSTSDHESEYTIHEVFSSKTMAEYFADGLLSELESAYQEELEDDPEFETGWHVWIEEREVK